MRSEPEMARSSLRISIRALGLLLFMTSAFAALSSGPAQATGVGPTDIEVKKTATVTGTVVSGVITIKNKGRNGAAISSLVDTLEVHFPKGVTPPVALPQGSDAKWFQVALVPGLQVNPNPVPVGATVTIPYTFDTCPADDYTGADKMRNVVSVTLINGPKGAKTVIKHSDDFEPPPREGCPPSCGDSIVDPGEQCDPPGSTCDPAGRICAGDCTCPTPSCGDSIVDTGEQCDPPGSTCDPAGRICGGDCTCPTPSCGDSIVDPGEQCDPPGSTCDAAGRICAGNCTCPAPSCGDSIVDPGEQCDPPGSTCGSAGRICAGNCTCPAPFCGDDIVDPGEECDPPTPRGTPSPDCPSSFEFCSTGCQCEPFD
jgi:hypothetical protein